MKKSELIYRLARSIERDGDENVYMYIESHDGDLECDVKGLDVNGDGTVEIYGEVK